MHFSFFLRSVAFAFFTVSKSFKNTKFLNQSQPLVNYHTQAHKLHGNNLPRMVQINT